MEPIEPGRGHFNHYPDADLPIAGSLDGWHSRYEHLHLFGGRSSLRSAKASCWDYRHNTAGRPGDLEDVAFWGAERDLNPLELTEKQVRQYVALLRRRKYSENTVRRRLTVMRSFMTR